MALRLAHQRSIFPPSYIFEVSGCRTQRLSPWNGGLARRVARRMIVCHDCQRLLFTQVIRGKKVPFFQRSITSTSSRFDSSASAALEQPEPLSQSTVLSHNSDIPSSLSVPVRKSRRKGTTTKSSAWAYLELTKPRLSVLIMLSTMSAYALAPYPASLPTLLFLSSGTFLCAASANTFNMIAEPEFDGMMARTRNRPLVRKALTITQARTFGVASGLTGAAVLAAGVNPVVALLGAGNIILYAAVYTPMKRLTIANTWVGAVVGGIPPLMGWAACSPDGSLVSHPGGLLLAGLLYAWQFPHFNAFAHMMRHDYARAGYKMMPVNNPELNARVALRYAVVCVPLCWGLVACGLVDPWYLIDSTLVNGWAVWKAWKFWRDGGEKGSARGLFFASLIQLPAVLILAMLHKDGLWDWLWETEDEEVKVTVMEADGVVA
jgi:heme o synthase